MKNKKAAFLVILGLIILISGFTYFLFRYRDNVIKIVKETRKESQGLPIIEEKTITDKEKPFNIELTYPTFKGLDDLNRKMEDTVNKELTEFKKVSLENDQAVKEVDIESYTKYPREYYLSISYEKGLIDENTISIILDTSNFTGGAHGSNYFTPINYDIKNKKDITLADLFPGQADYIKKISDFCIEDLKKQIYDRTEGMDAGWVQEGAGPDEKNFSVFMINKNNIVFYFPQYQVAAYAVGSFTVQMPR